MLHQQGGVGGGPPQVHVEAQGPDGAVAVLDGFAFATDAATAAPAVSFSPASGSLFPPQASKLPTPTPVTVTSSDASGNTGPRGPIKLLD